ncbi:MAG: transglycosylase SLT domain-containing protein [Chromatiaceae bacterium]|nr:transglycosylase SLT domain-containing protein [Chromatiaceae bacterium]
MSQSIPKQPPAATRRLCVALCAGWLCLAGWASAAAGLTPAQLTEQGLRYLHGEGVTRDSDRAVVYLCAAARRGHGVAAFELASLYYQGRGLTADDGLAAAWLHEAQRLGERPPARMANSLAGVKAKSPACIAGNGMDMQVDDRRRADLMIAIYEMAPQFELDPALVLEVVRAESDFNPKARSDKGAMGLMQLIPDTARRFGVKDPFEPIQNLRGGMAYLRWLLERFDGDLKLTLAGYNAGEGAVQRHGGVPPYAETREYVRRILRRYGTPPGSPDALI